MKLSDAIRLGAMDTFPARGVMMRTRRKYFFGHVGPVVKETCALGAAVHAGGCAVLTRPKSPDEPPPIRGQHTAAATTAHVVQFPDEWVSVLWRSVTCPACMGESVWAWDNPLFRLIPHLNDDHGWTRERIANFVASVEPPDLSVTGDAVSDHVDAQSGLLRA